VSIAYLKLSIAVGSDPIEGAILAGEQEPRPFCGWVELAAAIEAIRGAPPPQPGPAGNPRND
jgi:hypothetical protein